MIGNWFRNLGKGIGAFGRAVHGVGSFVRNAAHTAASYAAPAGAVLGHVLGSAGHHGAGAFVDRLGQTVSRAANAAAPIGAGLQGVGNVLRGHG
jgi:hypothetical protein